MRDTLAGDHNYKAIALQKYHVYYNICKVRANQQYSTISYFRDSGKALDIYDVLVWSLSSIDGLREGQIFWMTQQ